jgi:hypothetical protein
MNKTKTRKIYLGKLLKLYPACQHDACKAKTEKIYKGHKTTYGEMDYKGLKKLYSVVKSMNKKINTFIDVGSGRGKLCLYMAADDKIKKSIGIELVTNRHKDGLALQKKLSKEYARKVELINSDIFKVDIESKLPEDPQVFVWFSNLCFDQNITDDIFQKLEKDLPEGSILCCSNRCEAGNKAMQFVKSVPIDMSWNKGSNVYIYLKGTVGSL